MDNPKTLARTNDPETSKDAAKKMVESGKLSRQEEWLYGIIVEYTDNNLGDFTTKDIASYMTDEDGNDYFRWYDICRKRFSGLSNKFKITTTGERCDGCQVWRLV